MGSRPVGQCRESRLPKPKTSTKFILPSARPRRVGSYWPEWSPLGHPCLDKLRANQTRREHAKKCKQEGKRGGGEEGSEPEMVNVEPRVCRRPDASEGGPDSDTPPLNGYHTTLHNA
ncbi:hypothetical protein RRG08_013141 [Elysia crispata]|uniref:Uncharacterized protein n=1 Tax=Elysia crispata TaxID=231223 RepID=A0AAE1DQD8_9GAST|nr:hypothetical protein RRG08_013141 [Elysia crispata]